jgi:hypothetical protein
MQDFVITRGSTFTRVLRWQVRPFILTPITAITAATPPVITATGHGLVAGWRAAVVGAQGMRQINAKAYPPRMTDFHKITYISPTQISFNDVDASGFSAYTSGGALCSYTPVSLAGFSARMKIRATASDTTVLASLVSPTEIVLDDTNHTITVTIDAVTTAAYAFAAGVYDLELVSGDATPVVTKLLSGNIAVLDEITY